jgi:hypothetical protein
LETGHALRSSDRCAAGGKDARARYREAGRFGSAWMERDKASAGTGPGEAQGPHGSIDRGTAREEGKVLAPDQPPDGTGCRRERRAPGGFREASYRSGSGIARIPAGDPLSAGTEVERPESHATNVNGNEGISVLGVNRVSELETGQVRHGSPGKIAAANVKSESSKHQSEVSSERIEAESYRETHQSKIPEGSERLVSRDGETFLSARGSMP